MTALAWGLALLLALALNVVALLELVSSLIEGREADPRATWAVMLAGFTCVAHYLVRR